jgi:N-methylhydantoinase B/oxoprolinase/acetone carboxylase alpha subunit
MTLSAHFNRLVVKPWGAGGGCEGGNSRLAFCLAGSNEWQTAKDLFNTVSNGKFRNVTLHRGDRILIEIGGGGGYGPPFARLAEKVSKDVIDKLVTIEEAERLYGVVINGENAIVDTESTERLRTKIPV